MDRPRSKAATRKAGSAAEQSINAQLCALAIARLKTGSDEQEDVETGSRTTKRRRAFQMRARACKKGLEDGGRERCWRASCATEAQKQTAKKRNRYSSRFQIVSPTAWSRAGEVDGVSVQQGVFQVNCTSRSAAVVVTLESSIRLYRRYTSNPLVSQTAPYFSCSSSRISGTASPSNA